jgi:hypothetical protein
MKIYLSFRPSARHDPLNGDWAVPRLRLRSGRLARPIFILCHAGPRLQWHEPGWARFRPAQHGPLAGYSAESWTFSRGLLLCSPFWVCRDNSDGKPHMTNKTREMFSLCTLLYLVLVRLFPWGGGLEWIDQDYFTQILHNPARVGITKQPLNV